MMEGFKVIEVIGAATSVGKRTFAVDLAINLVKKG